MASQSGSAQFQVLFDSALQAYQETTGIGLTQHPLAVTLQGRAQGVSNARQRDRMMRAIKNTVSFLNPLSDPVGLVRQKHCSVCSMFLTFFQTSLSAAKTILTGLGILLNVRAIL
jgi:hypothetical protein